MGIDADVGDPSADEAGALSGAGDPEHLANMTIAIIRSDQEKFLLTIVFRLILHPFILSPCFTLVGNCGGTRYTTPRIFLTEQIRWAHPASCSR